MQIRTGYICTIALVVVATAASCTQTEVPVKPAEQEAPKNPLAGVWSVTERSPGGDEPTISPGQPGLYIFAKGHYSAVYVSSKEPRVPSKKDFEPTDDERIAQHKTIIVNTGTYSVDGSVITFRPIVAKSPGFVGGEAKSKFQIEGDVLTLEGQSIKAKGGESPPTTDSMKLKRIE